MSEQRVIYGEAGTGKNLSVEHFVPPADAKDAAKTSHVETVLLLLLLGIGFTSVQGDANYTSVAHCHLRCSGQLGVLPDASGVVATLPMCLLISAFKDRLSLMVEP